STAIPRAAHQRACPRPSTRSESNSGGRSPQGSSSRTLARSASCGVWIHGSVWLGRGLDPARVVAIQDAVAAARGRPYGVPVLTRPVIAAAAVLAAGVYLATPT